MAFDTVFRPERYLPPQTAGGLFEGTDCWTLPRNHRSPECSLLHARALRGGRALCVVLLNGLNKDKEVIVPLFKIRRLGLRPLKTPCFRGQSSLTALPSTSLNKEVITPFILFKPFSSNRVCVVAHDCGYPLSRYTCRATRVAADFLDFRAFCRCSTGVALHPLKILVSHPPPCAGRCRTEIWV